MRLPLARRNLRLSIRPQTVNFTKEKSWITGNAMVVNIDENESVAKTFLFQLLSSQDLKYLITGSGQPQITGTIKSHRTWLCHPTEQTQIGGYFREVDRLIGLQQPKHDKLVTLKKAMLQKMFPQPGTPTPEIRFKGFEGAWVEKKLGDVIDLGSGRDYKHLSAGNIPVYGTGGYMLSVNEALSNSINAVGMRGELNPLCGMIYLVSEKTPHSTAQICLRLGLREFTPLEIESLVLLDDNPVVIPCETPSQPAATSLSTEEEI